MVVVLVVLAAGSKGSCVVLVVSKGTIFCATVSNCSDCCGRGIVVVIAGVVVLGVTSLSFGSSIRLLPCSPDNTSSGSSWCPC